MGACGCKAINPMVNVPLPSTLGGFDRFSQENTFRCIEYLNEVRSADRGKPDKARRLCSSYAVEVRTSSGKTTEVVVSNVDDEVKLVYMLLCKQRAKRKRFKPPGDVRRESCLCAANLRLLQKAPLMFVDAIDPGFVNSQLQAPLSVVQITELCEVFQELNRSRSGQISMGEVVEWAQKRAPSILYSVFMFVFFETITTQRLHHLMIVEFIAALERFCIMSDEQLLRTVFETLADTTDMDGNMALDITVVMTRFPIPAKDNSQYISMPLLKALSKLYTKRLSQDVPDPHFVTWEGFQKLRKSARPSFDQLFQFHNLLRKDTLGHKVWNKRRRLIERMHEDGHNMAPLKGTLVKAFQIHPRRDVKNFYTVCPLDPAPGKREEDEDSLSGSDDDDRDRSRGSISSRSSRRRSGRSMTRLSIGEGVTPRDRPRSSSSKHYSPAELSPRATREFEEKLKKTYSFNPGGTSRSRGSTGRIPRSARSGRGAGRPSDDHLGSPISTSYDDDDPRRQDRAMSPLLPAPQGPPAPVEGAIPLPPGPPPPMGGVPLPLGPSPGPGAMGPPPHMMGGGPMMAPSPIGYGGPSPMMGMGPAPGMGGGMYAATGGIGAASFAAPRRDMGAGYDMGPPRANSYSGPSFPFQAAAAVGHFQQRASLPAPPPQRHFYY